MWAWGESVQFGALIYVYKIWILPYKQNGHLEGGFRSLSVFYDHANSLRGGIDDGIKCC